LLLTTEVGWINAALCCTCIKMHHHRTQKSQLCCIVRVWNARPGCSSVCLRGRCILQSIRLVFLRSAAGLVASGQTLKLFWIAHVVRLVQTHNFVAGSFFYNEPMARKVYSTANIALLPIQHVWVHNLYIYLWRSFWGQNKLLIKKIRRQKTIIGEKLSIDVWHDKSPTCWIPLQHFWSFLRSTQEPVTSGQ
jgi:hypothetical protein